MEARSRPLASTRRRLGRWLGRMRGETVDTTLRDLRAALARVDALEPELARSSDGELRAAAGRLARAAADGLAEGDVAGGVALAREAARRALGLRMHDTQVLAALGLAAGRIVELATGEGKTLAAVAPAWLDALGGRGVHVLTFNDYLARRDARWMAPVYALLGVRVGCVQEGMSADERRAAWSCDVTYATARQAGFDYLRDQRVLRPGERVHRPFHSALVDEADSILIDEARVPLVLAGGVIELPFDPRRLPEVVRRLRPDRDYEVDHATRSAALSDDGLRAVERELGVASLHDPARRHALTAVHLALHAEVLLRRDVDYLVRAGRIEVVDELTGRVVPDRRWPDGLHPALEAKEGLAVRPEGTVLASIPMQFFLGLYPRLAGMTATAAPAWEELRELYGKDVAVIPAHRPRIRTDAPDAVYTDRASKRSAIEEEIRRVHATGRPVLVGTWTVAESEALAAELGATGIACEVLNAKNDEDEAAIVARAGVRGAVTIATNLAGRGTDIRLGGPEGAARDEVAALGGLHVVGTHRHESARIDDQLRGRAGRQGDPGSSRFFVSLEDELVVRHGLAPAIAPLAAQAVPGLVRDPALLEEVERAQRIVDGRNFDVRRTLWKYSALAERQRRILSDLREDVLQRPAEIELFAGRDPERHAQLVRRLGPERASEVEQRVLLVAIDRAASNHLARLADVRESIHLHYLAGLDWFGGLWGLRKTPLDSFHELAVRAFEETHAELEADALATLAVLASGEGAIDLERDELRGPASTWTYLVSDTPFESAIARTYRTLLRGKAEEA